MLHYTGRYARNGNAIGFIDPLEGLAGQYYDRISDRIVDYILDGDLDELNKELVKNYQKEISGSI